MPDDLVTTSNADGTLPSDILTVHGGEVGLPIGMTLNGTMRARRLPDGRLFLFELPREFLAILYPGIALDPESVDVAESAPTPIEPEPVVTDETADTPPSEIIPDAPTIAEVI